MYTPFRDRDYKHSGYDRAMKTKIIRAKLIALLSDSPGPVEDRLLRSACTLTLSLFEMEEEYLSASPPQKMDRAYLPTLSALKDTLSKLNLLPKHTSPRDSGNGRTAPLDLVGLIDGDPEAFREL